MKRPQLALFLVIAFLLALTAPVRPSWACPDGTPCVHDRAHGYACAEKQCGAKASCCIAQTVRCKHGAWPGVAAKPTGPPALAEADHCQFSLTAPPRLTALAEQTTKFLAFAPALLPADLVVLPVLPPSAPVWRAEQTLGYRPPPLLFLGPSRAPPLA